MIKKLSNRRLSLLSVLGLIGLMVFIVSFNLLHSMDNEDESQNLVYDYNEDLAEAEELAKWYADKQREIVQNLYQRQNLEDKLKLKLAQIVQIRKSQLKEQKKIPKEVDVFLNRNDSFVDRDAFTVTHAQHLQKQSAEDFRNNLPRAIENINLVNVEEHVDQKIMMAVLRDHLAKIGQVIRSLKYLKTYLISSSSSSNPQHTISSGSSSNPQHSTNQEDSKDREEDGAPSAKCLRSSESTHDYILAIQAKRIRILKELDEDGAPSAKYMKDPRDLQEYFLALKDKRIRIFEELDECLYTSFPQVIKLRPTYSKEEFDRSLIMLRDNFEFNYGAAVTMMQNLGGQRLSDSMINEMRENYMRRFSFCLSCTTMGFDETEATRIMNNQKGPLDLEGDLKLVKGNKFKEEIRKHISKVILNK